MEIRTIVAAKGPNTTLSKLYLDGTFECYILEDADRGLTQEMSLKEIQKKKVHGQTAIPAGMYRLVVTMSPRFRRLLPRLLDIPGYAGVLIHAGNKHQDTSGCLLPGVAYQKLSNGDYFVTNSRMTFDDLFKKINAALARGEGIVIRVRV